MCPTEFGNTILYFATDSGRMEKNGQTGRKATVTQIMTLHVHSKRSFNLPLSSFSQPVPTRYFLSDRSGTRCDDLLL